MVGGSAGASEGVMSSSIPWYEIQLTILAHNQIPFWQEWRAESEGRTPWEAAQVVAFEVLSQICQQHGESSSLVLVN